MQREKLSLRMMFDGSICSNVESCPNESNDERIRIDCPIWSIDENPPIDCPMNCYFLGCIVLPRILDMILAVPLYWKWENFNVGASEHKRQEYSGIIVISISINIRHCISVSIQ